MTKFQTAATLLCAVGTVFLLGTSSLYFRLLEETANGGESVRSPFAKSIVEQAVDKGARVALKENGGGVLLSSNLVVPRLIGQGIFSTLGWWMPHVRWSSSQQCQARRKHPVHDANDAVLFEDENSRAGCRLVLGVPCKTDSVRATYQYISFRKEVRLKRFLLSVKSSALGMYRDEHQEGWFGLTVVFLFVGGDNMTVLLNCSAGTHDYKVTSKNTTTPHGKTVRAVLLMLGCHGYVGYVKFTDVSVQAVAASSEMNYLQAGQQTLFSLTETCPRSHLFTGVHGTSSSPPLSQVVLFEPQVKVNASDVTLVTQVSMDRINVLEQSMSYWEGPMSIALYVPSKSDIAETDHEWKKVYIRKKLRHPKFRTLCSVVAIFAKTVHEEYPINTLRNVAIRHVRSLNILLLDADFLPSPNFYTRYRSASVSWLNSKAVSAGSSIDKTAFVVPAFEFLSPPKEAVIAPKSKEELVERIRKGNDISPFSYFSSPLAHKPTNFAKWYEASEPYSITEYQDKFEPYVILRKTPTMPMYDERFHSYGMNKVSHIMELVAARYEFVILPHVWVIHVPHMESSHKKHFLQDPTERLRNRLKRFEFVARLMNFYGLGSCPRT